MASKRRVKRIAKRKECGAPGKLKDRYRDRTACVRAMIKYKKDFPNDTAVRSYHCKFCNGWHFGHYGGYRLLREVKK